MNTPSISRLPARSGLVWLMTGVGLFRSHALVWISVTGLLLFVSGLLELVPVIGAWLPELFSQIVSAAYMAGFASVSARGDMDAAEIRETLRPGAAALITLGGIYMLSMLLVAQLTMILGGDALRELASMGQSETTPDPERVWGLARQSMPSVLLALALFTPIAMATWFAAPLVAFSGLAPVAALRSSLRACLTNWRPLLVMSLALGLGLMLALILVALLFTLLGTLGNLLTLLVVFVAMVTVVPVVLAASWAAFREIFQPTGDAA